MNSDKLTILDALQGAAIVLDEETALILNVTQAVPLGLLINEILNLTPHGKGEQQAELSYKCDSESVTISIGGLGKTIEKFRSDSQEPGFNQLLIETFLQQINADIEIAQNQKDTLVITFEKSNSVKGSSNTITNHDNILFKKNVA